MRLVPQDPESGEGGDAITGGMSDCQSGAVHSLSCGTIICIAFDGDFGVCHADCHDGECRKAL